MALGLRHSTSYRNSILTNINRNITIRYLLKVSVTSLMIFSILFTVGNLSFHGVFLLSNVFTKNPNILKTTSNIKNVYDTNIVVNTRKEHSAFNWSVNNYTTPRAFKLLDKLVGQNTVKKSNEITAVISTTITQIITKTLSSNALSLRNAAQNASLVDVSNATATMSYIKAAPTFNFSEYLSKMYLSNVNVYQNYCLTLNNSVQYNVLHTTTFAINQQSVCLVAKVFMLIIVYSKSDHFSIRKTIRSTFASLNNIAVKHIRLIFILGLPSDKTIQQFVEEESTSYQDIIQGTFTEGHQNLTMSFALALKWIGHHCPQAEYIIKIDDDTYVDIFHVSEFLRYSPISNTFYCAVARKRGPVRNTNSHWYVPNNLFPQAVFPDYCLGFGFIFSIDLAPKLLGCALATVVIPVDDVFYTGLVRQRLKINIQDFTPGNSYKQLVPSDIKSSAAKDSIFFTSSHGVLLENVWRKLWKTNMIDFNTGLEF